MEDRFKFRACLEFWGSCNGKVYNKKVVMYKITPEPEEGVLIFVRDFEEQLKQNNLTDFEIKDIMDTFCGSEEWLHIHSEHVLSINQCTCLKDKNGKLIYEGDIVNILCETETTAVIKWYNDLAKFVLVFDGIRAGFDYYEGKDLEVIGNIHNNPELLEVIKNETV
jgi:uncharacterized phage protein (TIGR01671 family)